MEAQYDPTPAGLQALYADYLSEVKKTEQSRSQWAGLLGTGMSIGREPCQDKFIDAFTALAHAAAQSVSPDEAAAMVGYALEAPLRLPPDSTERWMLEAAQGELTGLIALLERGRAAALCRWYREEYPRARLLPSQKKMQKALEQQGGVKPRRFPFFR